MTNLTHARERSNIPPKLALPFLLVGALLCMGANWAEKPIESLASVAGEWHGNGTTAKGGDYFIEYIFKQDGSFESSRFKGKNKKGKAKHRDKRPESVQVNGEKLEWMSKKGRWIVTLYEDEKGNRMLKGLRKDGNMWELNEIK